MKFRLCYLVILDNDNLFKYSFCNMCIAFDLKYDILANRNNTGCTAEDFIFFNKVVIIIV